MKVATFWHPRIWDHFFLIYFFRRDVIAEMFSKNRSNRAIANSTLRWLRLPRREGSMQQTPHTSRPMWARHLITHLQKVEICQMRKRAGLARNLATRRQRHDLRLTQERGRAPTWGWGAVLMPPRAPTYAAWPAVHSAGISYDFTQAFLFVPRRLLFAIML